MTYPNTFRYTREHEWLQVEGAIGTVGITDYAQNSLGDIVFVDAPKVGDTVAAGKVFGSVESVKAVSDLYSRSAALSQPSIRIWSPRRKKSTPNHTRPGSSKCSCRTRKKPTSC